MAIQLATKTLATIDNRLSADNGTVFKRFLKEELTKAVSNYDQSYNFPYSSKLGYGKAGRACDREIWYSFRWFKKVTVPAKMIRLFDRGNLEEARFIALLRMIGCEVYAFDGNGNQYKTFSGHAMGALDAVIKNLPDLPNAIILGEFKTHGQKSFDKLRAQGVEISKVEHFAQMQCYMNKFDLEHALYFAVNKNTDELHAEIIKYDNRLANLYIERLRTISETKTPPLKISATANSYHCRYCDYNRVCHGLEDVDKNCRSCANLEATNEGKWFCNKYNSEVTKEQQLLGKDCPNWSRIA